MPRTRTPARGARRRRSGYTMNELMIALVLMGLVSAALFQLLRRQQVFYRATDELAIARSQIRDVNMILPTDLRSSSSAGWDILDPQPTSVQFRSQIGSAILCQYNTVNTAQIYLPPAILTNGNTLTAWLYPPTVGDLAYVYNDSTKPGNADDSWNRYTITDTASAADPTWCAPTNTPAFDSAADNATPRYRITLNTALDSTKEKVGAPIRFMREVKYSLFQAKDSKWYLGYQKCTPNANPSTPGTCTDSIQAVSGPFLPATNDSTTSGLYFTYYDKYKNRVTSASNANQIARVDIILRTKTTSFRRATGQSGGITTRRDSLMLSVGIRNRN